jgi:hypothetical protein
VHGGSVGAARKLQTSSTAFPIIFFDFKLRGKVAEGRLQDTVTNEINSNEKSDQTVDEPKSSRRLSLVQS